MSDATRPPEPSAGVALPASLPASDPLAAFAMLFPGLQARPFRLGGLQTFSGTYRLVEVDDVDNAVIVARERDGQRLGLGIADFVDAYRRGYNEGLDGSLIQ